MPDRTHEDRRFQRSKESFHEVLLRLLEKKSFSQITIKEIVGEADFNRGTFYSHYGRREDLLDEMIDETLERMIEAFRRPYEGESAVDFARITPGSIVLFDHFLTNRKFYRTMLSGSVSAEFRARLSDALDRVFREDLSFPPGEFGPELDLDLFLTYRIKGVIGLIIAWIESDFRQSPSYLAKQILLILRFGDRKVYLSHTKESD